MTRSVAVLIVLALLSACGLKRNLVLPPSAKNTQQQTTASPTPPVASDSVTATQPVTTTGNPASGN